MASQNCQDNGVAIELNVVEVLRWGVGRQLDDFLDRHTMLHGPFDIIVAADVVYIEMQVPLLMGTIRRILEHSLAAAQSRKGDSARLDSKAPQSAEACCYIAFCRRGVMLESLLEVAGKCRLVMTMLPGLTLDLFGEECSNECHAWMSCILHVTLAAEAPPHTLQNFLAGEAVSVKEMGSVTSEDDPFATSMTAALSIPIESI